MHKSDKVFVGVLIGIGLVFFISLESQEVSPDMKATSRIKSLCDSGYREYCANNKIKKNTDSTGTDNENSSNMNIKVLSESLNKKQDGSESVKIKSINAIPEQRTKKSTPVNINGQDKALSETIKETGFEIMPANNNNVTESPSSKINISKYGGMEEGSTEDLKNYSNYLQQEEDREDDRYESRQQEAMVDAYEDQQQEAMVDAYENASY